MIAFYLDENVSRGIVSLLNAGGYHVVTSHEMQMDGTTDDAQLFLAWRNQWVIVTYNRKDFFLMHQTLQRWSGTFGHSEIHAGILVPSDAVSVRAQARTLDIFAAAALPIENAYYEWRPLGEWVRRAS